MPSIYSKRKKRKKALSLGLGHTLTPEAVVKKSNSEKLQPNAFSTQSAKLERAILLGWEVWRKTIRVACFGGKACFLSLLVTESHIFKHASKMKKSYFFFEQG